MIEVDKVVDYLNNILRIDPSVVDELFLNRVPCSEKLHDNSTAQIRKHNNETYSIGVLGIINGLIGIGEEKQYGPIAMVIDEDDEVLEFVNLKSSTEETK